MHASDSVPASVPVSTAVPRLAIRRVPAHHARDWLAAGWADFRRAPASLAIASIAFLLLALLAVRGSSWLPTMLLPLYCGTVAAYSRMADRGQVFLAGSGAWRSLPLWGLAIGIILLGAVLNGLLALGVLLGMRAAVYLPTPLVGTVLALVFLARLLGMLALASCWLAPALIVNRDAGVLQAMRLSLAGSCRNAGAFLLIALIAAVVFTLAALPLGLGLVVALPVLAGAAVRAADDIVGDMS